MGLGRKLTWPLRTFFDRRFEGVIQRVDAGREEAGARELYAHGRQQELEHELTTLYRLLRADMDATNEAVDLRARALAEIAGHSEAMAEQLSELRDAIEELTALVNAQGQRNGRLDDRRTAD
jgi:hypothetical protein